MFYISEKINTSIYIRGVLVHVGLLYLPNLFLVVFGIDGDGAYERLDNVREELGHGDLPVGVEWIAGNLLGEIVHLLLERWHLVAEKPMESVRDSGAGELFVVDVEAVEAG